MPAGGGSRTCPHRQGTRDRGFSHLPPLNRAAPRAFREVSWMGAFTRRSGSGHLGTATKCPSNSCQTTALPSLNQHLPWHGRAVRPPRRSAQGWLLIGFISLYWSRNESRDSSRLCCRFAIKPQTGGKFCAGRRPRVPRCSWITFN